MVTHQFVPSLPPAAIIRAMTGETRRTSLNDEYTQQGTLAERKLIEFIVVIVPRQK
jgi:hypothetical protein